MLKERKAQGRDPTSHLQEKESSSRPQESIVELPNHKKKRSNESHETFCANAQYRTLGELSPELQFDPICNLLGRGQTRTTFSPSAMSSGGMIGQG